MITKGDVFKEIISPKDVEEQEEPKMGLLIYKGVYMAIRLLLDIRHNQVRISNGEKLQLKAQTPASETRFDNEKDKPDNPVIKRTDNINVDK